MPDLEAISDDLLETVREAIEPPTISAADALEILEALEVGIRATIAGLRHDLGLEVRP